MQSLGPFRTHFTSNCKVTKKYKKRKGWFCRAVEATSKGGIALVKWESCRLREEAVLKNLDQIAWSFFTGLPLQAF